MSRLYRTIFVLAFCFAAAVAMRLYLGRVAASLEGDGADGKVPAGVQQGIAVLPEAVAG